MQCIVRVHAPVKYFLLRQLVLQGTLRCNQLRLCGQLSTDNQWQQILPMIIVTRTLASFKSAIIYKKLAAASQEICTAKPARLGCVMRCWYRTSERPSMVSIRSKTVRCHYNYVKRAEEEEVTFDVCMTFKEHSRSEHQGVRRYYRRRKVTQLETKNRLKKKKVGRYRQV